MQTNRVGLVGVGNMGLAMLQNLRAQGVPVQAFDVLPERCALALAEGAQLVASARDFQAGTCVIVAVVDALQTIAVVQDVTLSTNKITSVILCPTIAPDDVLVCAQLLAARGIDCIDAPMSGGPARARDGSMSLMVACSDAVFDAHATLLSALSSRLFRIGECVGDAAKTKLVNNLLASINLAGAAECLALAERLGLDLNTTLAVLAQSSGASWIAQDRLPRAVAGDFAPRAHTTLLAKDSALALSLANSVQFDAQLGAASAAVFAQALAAGLGGLDDASLYQLMQQRTLPPCSG
jgi:L-threonate 2-dehydrogenase